MEENKKISNGMNKKTLLLLGAIAIVLFVVGGYKTKENGLSSFFNKKSQVLTEEEAKDKALSFIVGNLVQPKTEVKVESIIMENGLYKLELDVNGQKITAYMTGDGAKFFPNVIDMNVEPDKQAENVAPSAVQEIPKSDKPVVDLYVMSFCPFGNKAEDTLKPAYELLKDKVDFNFRYIVSSEGETINSLHGQTEVDQNEREACVAKNYGKDKWMEFVTYVNTNCGSDGSCWGEGAKELSINTDQINSCVASEGITLMKADEKASAEARASGSPTMLINGVPTNVVYQYGNSEGYKQTICDAFNQSPAECAQKLESATQTSEGGSCG